MVDFEVVPFSLGVAASKPPDDKAFDFYQAVVRLIAKDEVAQFIGEKSRASVTVPVKALSKAPARVYEPLTRALAMTKPGAQFVLLDLASSDSIDIVRGATYTHIARAIDSFLADRAGQKMIVLLWDLHPSEDAFQKLLKPYISASTIVLIADDGSSTDKGLLPSSYLRVRALAPLDAARLLRAKLLKRSGWFRRETRDGRTLFARHYFDASHCSDEVHDLILSHLRKHSIDFLVYSTLDSDWLESPLLGACISQGVPFLTVDQAKSMHPVDGIRKILLVVPMTDTGETVARLVKSLSHLTVSGEILVLSILSTEGQDETLGVRQIRQAGGPEVQVEYLLRVRQDKVEINDPNCDPIHMGIPESRGGVEAARGLTTYEFWDLVRLAGVKEEEDVPVWRTSIGVVPDFPRLLRDHGYGPWFARKLWQMVAPILREFAQDAIFVCPGGEAGSGTLAYYLELFSGARVVQVPRSVIDSVVLDSTPEKRQALEVWDVRQPWNLELRSASVHSVVLFDEFIGSGRTLDALARIVSAGDFHVAAICCILDLAPSRPRQQTVYSLYEWQRPSTDAQTGLSA